MKKQIKYISAGMLAGMLLCGGELQASNRMTEMHVCLADAIQKDNRPEISNRLFRSNAVEKEILRVQKLLKNAKLAWMFIQSPNQKIPDRKTKCVIKTHINIKQNVIFGAKLKPV